MLLGQGDRRELLTLVGGSGAGQKEQEAADGGGSVERVNPPPHHRGGQRDSAEGFTENGGEHQLYAATPTWRWQQSRGVEDEERLENETGPPWSGRANPDRMHQNRENQGGKYHEARTDVHDRGRENGRHVWKPDAPQTAGIEPELTEGRCKDGPPRVTQPQTSPGGGGFVTL